MFRYKQCLIDFSEKDSDIILCAWNDTPDHMIVDDRFGKQIPKV